MANEAILNTPAYISYEDMKQITNKTLAKVDTKITDKDVTIVSSDLKIGEGENEKIVGKKYTYTKGTGETATTVDIEVPKVEITKATDGTDESAATKYTISVGGVALSETINIPKDLMVESGSVITLEADEEGKYKDGEILVTDSSDEEGTAKKFIKIILNSTSAAPIYILVNDLVDIYTGTPTDVQATADVVISIDNSTNVITAELSQDVKNKLGGVVSIGSDTITDIEANEEAGTEAHTVTYLQTITKVGEEETKAPFMRSLTKSEIDSLFV